ncbi:hypothetical protein Trydic_g2989 [Trypoxylus dichotomus]
MEVVVKFDRNTTKPALTPEDYAVTYCAVQDLRMEKRVLRMFKLLKTFDIKLLNSEKFYTCVVKNGNCSVWQLKDYHIKSRPIAQSEIAQN